MADDFPAVRPGDVLGLIFRPAAALFVHNGLPVAEVKVVVDEASSKVPYLWQDDNTQMSTRDK